MAEAIATPRINATYLDSFTNQTVRLIGKVVQLRGEQATVDSMGNVTAHLNRVRAGPLLGRTRACSSSFQNGVSLQVKLEPRSCSVRLGAGIPHRIA